ncbi:hypothetical protein CLIB1423_14S02256 [[Candida] railenensis]|uniref:Uncharacterized protein n=1 Tax=[Candida] railenensis TaxID=45579 RepID=A0A9P0QSE2_9ASCO|nr:hypothetical protein CLIB1423_14S02256 [[Candida] railenensis]
MVIRSLVSSVVFSLPLADKIVPDVVARKLKGDSDNNDDLVPYPYPKLQESREQRIYKKILAKRKYSQVVTAPTSPLSGSSSTFSPAPPYSRSNNLHYVEEDDDDYYPGGAMLAVEPIHKTSPPLSHRRDPSTNNLDSDYGTLIPSSASSQNVDYKRKVSFPQELQNDQSALGIYSSSSREETSNDRVNRYLEEQNEKFDALINRNIEVVLENDEAVLPLTLQESIYDLLDVRDRNLSHKFQDISSIVGIAASSVLPSISLPWRGKEATGESSLELLSSASIPSSSRATSTSSPSLSLSSPSTFAYPSKKVEKSEYLPSVRAMVDDLDVYKKVQLYKYLQEDLDVYEDAKDEMFGANTPSSSSPDDSHYLQLSESGITLDKIQALAILSVRLTFAGIKLAIPISIRLYHKFTENDLYMINKKNFNSLLGFLIKLLKVVEEKVNGDTISVYQYGHQNSTSPESTSDQSNISPKGDPFDELYDEMANSASQFFSNQLNDATEEAIQKNDSSTWQGMAINYILNQYISSRDPNSVAVRRRSGKIHYKDPKYSKYYSKGGYQYRDDEFSSSSPSNSSNDLISESEKNDVSILRAAEQFAGEL